MVKAGGLQMSTISSCNFSTTPLHIVSKNYLLDPHDIQLKQLAIFVGWMCLVPKQTFHDQKNLCSSAQENSFHGEGTRAGRAGLLRSWSLPISDLVDRTGSLKQ